MAIFVIFVVLLSENKYDDDDAVVHPSTVAVYKFQSSISVCYL